MDGMAGKSIRVTVWNEFVHEKEHQAVRDVYPKGIHETIADGLRASGGLDVGTATLDQREQGLPVDLLAKTDVLIWWAHMAHAKVLDETAARVQQRVLDGMGFIVLHSGHMSKPFRRLLGTDGTLRWREAAEKEIIWNIAPSHEIAQGVGPCIQLDEEEMYGEPFGIPEPDKLVFVSWFEGGDVFRSGCCWERGNGRIFYFRPGHEMHPTYHKKEIIHVIANACRWAAPRIIVESRDCENVKVPLNPIKGKKN
jgi:trehalose utilization protein